MPNLLVVLVVAILLALVFPRSRRRFSSSSVATSQGGDQIEIAPGAAARRPIRENTYLPFGTVTVTAALVEPRVTLIQTRPAPDLLPCEEGTVESVLA